jgi:type IV secretory pathway VirB2 component (pilin)
LFICAFIEFAHEEYANMKHITNTSSPVWHITLMALVSVIIVTLPDFAFAWGQDTPMGMVLCNAASFMAGSAGKGMATIGVSVIGIGAMLGKVSWGMAMTLGIGIAILFNAPYIVNDLGAGSEGC